MIRKVLVVLATVMVAAGLTYSAAWLIGVDFGGITGADPDAAIGEGTRFGEDGVTICVEGIDVALADESDARETVVATLSKLADDPLWENPTKTNRSADDQVRRGCDSEPVALQPDAGVADLGGKGVFLKGDGVPIVSERDLTTDIRVYVLTPETMARVFGADRKSALTNEAWIVSGSEATGVNQALYLSSDVVDDQALISERLRRATGLWEPKW